MYSLHSADKNVASETGVILLPAIRIVKSVCNMIIYIRDTITFILSFLNTNVVYLVVSGTSWKTF